MSVQERPDELIRLLRPEFAGRFGADSPASLTWGKIMLIPPAGAPVTTYPVTVAGLLAALTAATVAGSMIWVPPGSFNTAITIPANIALVALGEKVSINGQWTLNSGVVVANIVQTQSSSSAGALSGVVGPSSGIAYMKNCSINVENSGSGDAYAVNQSGAGELWLWGCATYGNASGGGSGYGARRSAGTLYVTDDGRHRGSTGKFSGKVELFDPEDVIHLKTSTFTQLYNATDAGLTAALAAASSGDLVKLPAQKTITGGPWTNPAGVTIYSDDRNLTTILSGDLTNNGKIKNLRVKGNTVQTSTAANIDSCQLRASSGRVIDITGGWLVYSEVILEVGAAYGIHSSAVAPATGPFIAFNIVNTDGTDQAGVGIYVKNAKARLDHNFAFTWLGDAIQIEEAESASHNIGVSREADGFVHTTGTVTIYNSHFATLDEGATGTVYGVNLSAAVTFNHVSWNTINGDSNITYERGDRGAYKSTENHADDIEDATYTHHWPKSKLDGTTAPTADEDSGDGYDVGSIWVDVTNDNAYICQDATVGAAVWAQIDGAGASSTGEIFLTATGGWPSTTSGCAAAAKTEHVTNDIDLYSLDFDQTTIEYAQWSVWMPDDWDAGTVTFKAVWTAAGGSAAQTVEWNLQGRSYADDDAIDQSWGTAIEVSDALIATGDVHYTAESGAVTLAGTPAAGELVQFRAWRDASNDTLAADARLLGIKVYFAKA